MQDNTKLVAMDSLNKSRHYVLQANWARAFAHFLLFLELLPASERQHFEAEFENILYNLGCSLENIKRVEDLHKCYFNGLRYFPSNSRMLTAFGSHLLKLNQPKLALPYLEAAHMLNSKYLIAEKNLQTAKMDILPRWHFRMLNDRKRNEAYHMAIQNAITPEHNRVLDIGAGCGLLSFYASQCKEAKRIIAVESSESLAEIACNALRGTTVTVLNKSSLELSSINGNTKLFNVLITEIFDTAIFGEHALESFIHAWDNLLEVSAKVVPAAVDIFIVGVSSREISRQHKLIRKPELNLDVCVVKTCSEPYSAEDVNEKDLVYITDIQKVVSVNFNDVEQLKDLYVKTDAIPIVTLKCLNSGAINAFVVWFDLHLNADITLTTNPRKEERVRCWEQAVFYVDHPVTLQRDENIKLQVSCLESLLKVEILKHDPLCKYCFHISQEMITFLNDDQVLKAAEQLQLPARFNRKGCQIVDLNPVPIFALLQAQRGLIAHYMCVANTDADMKFLHHLWQAGSNAVATWEIYTWEEMYRKLPDQSVDVIFLNPISENGILQEQLFSQLETLRGALKPDGIVLPEEVRLEIELVDSSHLYEDIKVDGRNLFGFEVAEEINKYAVLEQWQIEPRVYSRKILYSLTTDFNILTEDNADKSSTYNVNIPCSGTANGILYYFKMVYSPTEFVQTSNSCHYKAACFVLDQPLVINEGDIVKVTVIQHAGLMKISCAKS